MTTRIRIIFGAVALCALMQAAVYGYITWDNAQWTKQTAAYERMMGRDPSVRMVDHMASMGR